jgi:hypothetical protein
MGLIATGLLQYEGRPGGTVGCTVIIHFPGFNGIKCWTQTGGDTLTY